MRACVRACVRTYVRVCVFKNEVTEDEIQFVCFCPLHKELRLKYTQPYLQTECLIIIFLNASLDAVSREKGKEEKKLRYLHVTVTDLLLYIWAHLSMMGKYPTPTHHLNHVYLPNDDDVQRKKKIGTCGEQTGPCGRPQCVDTHFFHN